MHLIESHSKELRALLDARAKAGTPISEVFFAACGGSLVDLYSGKYFLTSESRQLRSDLITANEFVHAVPKALGKKSVVIICSHSGRTPELVAAAKRSKAAGALTITFTHNPEADIARFSDLNILYEWGDITRVLNNPMAINLALCLEILHQAEGYEHYDTFLEALRRTDAVVAAACKKSEGPAAAFAATYQHETMFYSLSSGASYGHAYGFAICSLMEMQWLDAAAIHSGEFFHGPFEVTDSESNFIVLVNEGRTRPLDLRVLEFLNSHAGKYVVIDARELGINTLPEPVVEFFNPVLFYSVLCVYRQALADIRNHPLDTRRYMGKVPY